MHLALEKHDETYDELVDLVGPSAARRVFEDFKKGRNLRLAAALREQTEVGRQNSKMEHRSVDGIGQVQRRYGPKLRHAITELYGADALKDDKFMDGLNRDNPNFNFKPTYKGKTTIIKSI